MKEKRLQILDKLSKGEITSEQADKELLFLFRVSISSDCEHDVRNFKDRQECEKCGEVWIRQ